MTEHGTALDTGARIEELQIEKELGVGGFGITYLARDLHLDVRVAVKEYLPDVWGTRRLDGTVGPRSASHADNYRWGLKRFLDEARVLARLTHPRIVRVLRVILARGTAYMVMEYVEGRSLEEELRSAGRIGEARMREVLDGLSEGLAAVHAAGLVHRDVKPANVMLRAQDASPVLVDFGAARQLVGRESKPMTEVLTPGYAPIEQYHAGEQGPWTDIYALGALAYECLSGDLPAAAPARTNRDPVRSLGEMARGVSGELAEAVDAALAVYAEDRPQNIAAWRRLLWPPLLPPDDESEDVAVGHGGWTGVARRWGLPVAGAALLAALGLWWVGRSPGRSQGSAAEPQRGAEGVAAPLDSIRLADSIAADPRRPGRVFRDCTGCPEMIVVPAGSYMMGSPTSEAGRDNSEGPRHEVSIEYPLAVGAYEVTFAEWDACVSAGGCGGYRPDDEGWGRARHPVTNVSWEDAREYVAWLSDETGAEYRLLSEAEWEYVARARTGTARYWGENEREQCRYANGNDDRVPCSDGHEYTAPAGSFEPNDFGLYDVLGNVWEWTEDCRNESYAGAPGDGSDWRSGDCSLRVLRGGTWNDEPENLRSATRSSLSTDRRGSYLGFRVARTLASTASSSATTGLPAADTAEGALVRAVRSNSDLSVVEALLAAGADVNAPYDHTTPLLAAFGNRPVSLELVEVLLDAGADVLRPSDYPDDDSTPWDYALRERDLPAEIRVRMRNLAGLIAGCEYWYQPHGFFATATPAAVRACLDGGAEPGTNSSPNRRTFLMNAALSGADAAVIRMLLDAGASNVQGALCAVAEETTDPAIVIALLRGGGEALASCIHPVAQDWPGHRTPFLQAVEHGNRSGVAGFLQFGVNPMAEARHAEWSDPDAEPTTPIHLAARRGHPSIVDILLDYGADPAARDVQGRTALEYALDNDAFVNSNALRRMREIGGRWSVARPTSRMCPCGRLGNGSRSAPEAERVERS